ncbi:hypothetical protein ABH926_003268 [Catenulispora sp. GP43]|uniref:hypothetical protein n=1 Tax=Catenulispora sp. GP43 TaxID=3156263 RepID=UPI0035125183
MNDQDWMQDMFARSRREAEPGWTPDSAAIAVGGRRRRRLRAVSVGGGAVGALAVTAAVVIGLGGFGGALSSAPPPATPHSTSVFDYASLAVNGSGNPTANVLPVSAVDKMSGLIDALDPTHAHLRNLEVADMRRVPTYRTVGDGSSAVKGIVAITATSVYTADGTVPAPDAAGPNGSLAITVAANADQLGSVPFHTPDVSTENVPCGYMLQNAFQDTPPQHDAHWSRCVSTPLPDGSKVDSTSTPDGQGTVSVAVREYPNGGGGIVLVWIDYANEQTTVTDPTRIDQAPDPSVVLKPNPVGEKELAAILAAPQFGPTGKPKPVGSGPKQFLKTGDLGADAVYVPDSSGGGTGDLPMDNGCEYKDINPLAKSGRMARYTVTVPDGRNLTVTELEYPLVHGTGAAAMATARSQAKGGCDQSSQLYSKDTVTDLPAGIGDEAFIENGVGTDAVTVWMRFGDTILRVDVTGGQAAMPDLSSPADQAWLRNVARAVAGHWTAKD